MYEFFKNTGIQFFGHSLNDALDTQGNNNFEFAYRLFLNEWLPLSIDGERNLVRFYLGRNNDIEFVVYCIDTTIRDDALYKSSMIAVDEAQELELTQCFQPGSINYITPNDVPVTEECSRWLNSISERKEQTTIHKMGLASPPCDIDTAYRNFIVLLIKTKTKPIDINFVPAVKILSDLAHASVTIETHLSLDLGNTRTIGLFTERDPTSRKYNLGNAKPLQVLNFDRLQKEGVVYLDQYSDQSNHSSQFDYLISSMVRFKKSIFQKYPETKNFILPSIAVIGSEAENLTESGLEQGSSGISGPKRYLWDKKETVEFWKFHEPGAGNISGSILKNLPLDDNDDLFSNGAVALTGNPLSPRYPRRTMMVFAAVEILYQAFCQVNSLHYRKRTGSPGIKRNLNKIILSFPTAMPFWERERLKKQFEKALKILHEMKVFNYSLEYVQIILGSDEATCSQLAFLYGEARRFLENSDKFFNYVSGSKIENSLRIASLDIGGGTTDLMIADYSMENPDAPANPTMIQKMVYSDGVNIAGDDILKSLITEGVIPMIRKALESDKREDVFPEYFGSGSPDADKQIRVDAMYGFLIPIAEFYLHVIEKGDFIHQSEIKKITSFEKLNEYLQENNLRRIKPFGDLSYLNKHNILNTETDYSGLRIQNILPDFSFLEKVIMDSYKDVLIRFAVAINQFHPNFLILGGRTTSLPVIGQCLRNWLTITPSRIIQLTDYYAGDWYPFSRLGRIIDPKTAVVIGNTVSYLSRQRLLEDVNIVSEGETSDYTLNFIGTVPSPQKKMSEMAILYRDGESSNSASFSFANKSYILFRNINDEAMPCSLMYSFDLHVNNGEDHYIIATGNPIEITLDFSNPKEEIRISDVNGDIMKPGDDNSKRPAQVDDFLLREQTLFDEEYYLDHGKFSIPVF